MKLNHWDRHPGVRTGAQLTFGERAADILKARFGSWGFLITLNTIISVWVLLNTVVLGHPFDPYPFILLNLGLSWLAAMQGGALQIASNRGDRIASEMAMHSLENSETLLTINKQQLELLQAVHDMQQQLADLKKATADQEPEAA